MDKNSMLKLKEVLQTVGKSQVWLSQQLGISKSGMNNLVTGRSKPSMQRVYEIAEILEVSIFDLLEPNDYPSIFDKPKNSLEDRVDSLEQEVQQLRAEIREIKGQHLAV